MSGSIDLESARRPPALDAVLKSQGVPPGARVSDRVLELVRTAQDRYAALAEPRGIFRELGAGDFEEVFLGDGRNARRTPLERIYRRADRLALFAVTVGEPVCREIRRLFDANQPALGSMLDGIASHQADAAASLAAAQLPATAARQGAGPNVRSLPYSPGYCGWHISGQRSLFDALRPERIGITLNDSFLMQPLKSVSGVVVVGDAEIHRFENDFDFCDDCRAPDCRIRIASVAEGPAGVHSSGGLEWTS